MADWGEVYAYVNTVAAPYLWVMIHFKIPSEYLKSPSTEPYILCFPTHTYLVT